MKMKAGQLVPKTVGTLLVWITVMGGAFASPSSAFAQLVFEPGQSLNIATPQSIVTEDFDCDGHLDLAVTSTFGPGTMIYFGDGSGTFTGPTTALSDSAYHLIAAHIDGDQHLDLAVTNIQDSTVSVFLGSISGSFTESQEITTGSVPISVAAGDLDEDGHTDLAVTNHGSNTVTLCFGNGDGTFSSFTNLGFVVSPSFVVMGHFNSDTHLDMVISSSLDSNFRIFYGNGNGGFPSPSNYAIGINDQVWFMYSQDVNDDNLPDIVAPCPQNQAVAVLLTESTGGFAPVLVYPVGTQPQWTVLEDLDLDQNIDLVTANSSSDDISINLGDSLGFFGAPQSFPAGTNCVSVTSHDFDEDGRPDLAVANLFDNSLDIFFNRTTPVSYSFERGDANLDGQVDLGDALTLLGYLFVGGSSIPCLDSGDTDDNGLVDLGDAIRLLSYFFTSGPAPALPFGSCDEDPTSDSLPGCVIPPTACP